MPAGSEKVSEKVRVTLTVSAQQSTTFVAHARDGLAEKLFRALLSPP